MLCWAVVLCLKARLTVIRVTGRFDLDTSGAVIAPSNGYPAWIGCIGRAVSTHYVLNGNSTILTWLRPQIYFVSRPSEQSSCRYRQRDSPILSLI
jgi:hypothetical protein